MKAFNSNCQQWLRAELARARPSEPMSYGRAKYLADNFTVLAHVAGFEDGADATVRLSRTGKVHIALNSSRRGSGFIADYGPDPAAPPV